jgi:senataxin
MRRHDCPANTMYSPPGSGKTKTIVAMVGALLTDKFPAPGVPISHPRGGQPKAQQEMQVQKKLLICAPSNAAVDELVTRLKKGVKTLKGDFQKINVIRLGRSDAINSNVKDVTLDELVRAKMEGDGKSGSVAVSKRDKMFQEAGELKEAVNGLRTKIEDARSGGNEELVRRLQRELDGKKRDQARIGAMIEDDKANGNTTSRENEITRRRLQQEIVDSAHVLCATLSGSGHEMFKHLDVEFETVIIDEAAQCIELSAIIPLKYGCSKCILVGDPKQLPPTVLSKSAARYGYEQSLFVRMQQNHPNDVHLLDVQYRMHPEISKFPSNQFYDGKLVDGEGLAKLRNMPWHTNGILGPYRFFNVKGTQTNGASGHSFINVEEVRDALRLYNRLRSDYRSYDFRGKIGIITPYKAQLKELRRVFQSSCGEKVFDEIDFNTTDAFQGRESEIIIFSCVRARASGGIGFLEDIRRMNVGLTRAKSSLWILGDSRSLMQGEFWARLIEDAKARHLYSERVTEQEMSLTRPSAASRSAEGSFPNTADSGSPAIIASVEMADIPSSGRTSIASLEMTDIPPSRRTSIASLEMIDYLDEREGTVMSDDSAFRATSVAFSASRASSLSLPPNRLPSGQFKAKVVTRKSFEEREQIGKAVEDCDKQEDEEKYKEECKKPDRHPPVAKGTLFDRTAVWRRTGPGAVYEKDGAVALSTVDGDFFCHVCGSGAHFTKECGDVAWLQDKGRLCDRCKKPPAHNPLDCTVSRCLSYGKFGHREADCKGLRMTNEKRKHVIKQEEAFERNKANRRLQPLAVSGISSAAPGSYEGSQTSFNKSSKHARAVSPVKEDGLETTQVR